MTGKNVKDMNSKGVAVELILDKETKATWQKGLEHSIYKASNNKQLQQLCWTDKNGNIRHDNWEYSGDYLIKKNLKNKNSYYESHVAGFDKNWLLKIKPTDKKKGTGNDDYIDKYPKAYIDGIIKAYETHKMVNGRFVLDNGGQTLAMDMMCYQVKISVVG